MRHIPLIKPDLPAFEAVEGAFREILANGKITNFGKYVGQFEKEAADYLGVDAVTVSSGTMGMILALPTIQPRAFLPPEVSDPQKPPDWQLRPHPPPPRS